MNIYQITGRNMDVTDALKDYVENKMSRLERFHGHITDAKVILQIREVRDESRRARVEVMLHIPNGIIRAEENHSDMYAAIDKASDVLERQLRKVKTKAMRHRHENDFVSDNSGMVGATIEGSNEALEDEDETPEIVRTKRFDMRPMTPEDAAMQMEALHHDFYVFLNQTTNATAVVYRRRDGNYGLIEPRV